VDPAEDGLNCEIAHTLVGMLARLPPCERPAAFLLRLPSGVVATRLCECCKDRMLAINPRVVAEPLR